MIVQEQHNLRHFSVTQVQPCAQVPSLESTRAIANVFVRAKVERLRAWTCEANVEREKFVCAQSAYNIVVITVLITIKTPRNVFVLQILQM